MNAFQLMNFSLNDRGESLFTFEGKTRRVQRVPYVYQLPVFSNLAVGANGTQSVNVDASSDFLWTESSYEFDLAGAAFLYNTRPIPNMDVFIIDTGSSRNLMNADVPVTSLFGKPETPFMRNLPYLFAAGGTISVKATNRDAAVVTGNLRLSLIGEQLQYL